MGQTGYTNIPGGVARAPFGGRTIYIDGLPYRAMNWQPKGESREIVRPDGNGDEADVMIRKGPRKQSGLQLQLSSKSTPVPAEFTEFDVDGVAYVLSNPTEIRPEGEFWTCEIDIRSVTPIAQLP